MKENIRRALLVALHETEGVGWKTIERLMNRGLPEDMLDYKEPDWQDCGLSVEMARRLGSTLRDRALQFLDHPPQGIEIITRLDEIYPDMLQSSPQAPWVLYASGNIHLLKTPGLAMVGTRVPTAYGRKVGSMLAEELCRAGLTIVSGLARGIDGVVHEAALRCGGNTIAVLGCGVDIVYPSENRLLYEEIVHKGLLVSEYPPGTRALPGFFPRRNRIIAGLTWGTLVVEADERSGSLITSDAALEAGRDVFAVPGPITSPKSRGALNLIKQGAKLVTSGSDVMEEYEWRLPNLIPVRQEGAAGAETETSSESEKLTNDETRIYHMLEQGPGTPDELLDRTGWDFGHLHSVLLSLILKKQISQLPGAIYKLI